MIIKRVCCESRSILILQIKVSHLFQKISKYSLNKLLKIRLNIVNGIIASTLDKDEVSLIRRVVQGTLGRGNDAIINIDFCVLVTVAIY